MIAGEARRLTLGTLVLVALAAVVVSRWEVTSDITHFLPGGQRDERLALARELAGGELSRTLLVLVEAPAGTPASALAALGAEFEARLRAEPRVAAELETPEALRGGPPDGLEEALWALYQPRSFGFLADPGPWSADALAERLAALKRQLATPLSSMVGRVAPADPWLVLPGLLEGLRGATGDELVVVEGRFLTADERAAVLFLATRSAAFDAPAMRPVLDGLHAAFDDLDAEHGGALELSLSGSARFAVRAEAAIRADVQRVGIGSLLGLGLLLLVLFRSLRLLALTLPVLATGFGAGLAACLLSFGRVHGLTLAFGAALIGVSIDYTVHYHCHQVLARDPAGPRATLSRIWTGLGLGAATTVVGFVALLVATFPGLRELALFAAVGIGAALWATSCFLPGLTATAPPVTAAARRSASAIHTLLEVLDRRRHWSWVPVVAVTLVAAVGLPRATWNDDVADLNQLDPGLMAEDAAARARVAPYEQGRMVAATGPDSEAALAVNDAVAVALAEAVSAGELDGFRGAAGLLPATATQRARDARLREDSGLWSRLVVAAEQQGFVPAAFEPLRETLAAAPPTPLTPDDLTGTPLASLVDPFLMEGPDGPAVLHFVHGLHDEEALAARLAAIPGAHLLDLSTIFSRAYGAYRQRMTQLLLLGLAAVLGLVALRHRRLRPTVAACLPALLAAAGTVAVLSLAGVALNMLSLVSLLMVVSMGVDYGVFLVEAGDDREALAATHLAVGVAAISTLLGFGLLALSDHPALFSIGAPAAVGVLLCVVLAPTVRLLAAPAPEPTDAGT